MAGLTMAMKPWPILPDSDRLDLDPRNGLQVIRVHRYLTFSFASNSFGFVSRADLTPAHGAWYMEPPE